MKSIRCFCVDDVVLNNQPPQLDSFPNLNEIRLERPERNRCSTPSQIFPLKEVPLFELRVYDVKVISRIGCDLSLKWRSFGHSENKVLSIQTANKTFLPLISP